MRTGDLVFIYHSMGNPGVVGLAEVVGNGRPDPANPALAVADFKFRALIDPPISLRDVKDSGKFTDWALVRQSRLSTMEAPLNFVEWVRSIRPDVPL